MTLNKIASIYYLWTAVDPVSALKLEKIRVKFSITPIISTKICLDYKEYDIFHKIEGYWCPVLYTLAYDSIRQLRE